MDRGCLLLATFLAACLPGVRAQSVDEIVARALAARGGADRIRALRSQRLTGSISFGAEDGSPLQVEMKRPCSWKAFRAVGQLR